MIGASIAKRNISYNKIASEIVKVAYKLHGQGLFSYVSSHNSVRAIMSHIQAEMTDLYSEIVEHVDGDKIEIPRDDFLSQAEAYQNQVDAITTLVSRILRIEQCGKVKSNFINEQAQRSSITYNCHYKECPNCNKNYEQTLDERHFHNARYVFSTEQIKGAKWDTIRRKIARSGSMWMSIPTVHGESMVFMNDEIGVNAVKDYVQAHKVFVRDAVIKVNIEPYEDGVFQAHDAPGIYLPITELQNFREIGNSERHGGFISGSLDPEQFLHGDGKADKQEGQEDEKDTSLVQIVHIKTLVCDAQLSHKHLDEAYKTSIKMALDKMALTIDLRSLNPNKRDHREAYAQFIQDSNLYYRDLIIARLNDEHGKGEVYMGEANKQLKIRVMHMDHFATNVLDDYFSEIERRRANNEPETGFRYGEGWFTMPTPQRT